MLSRRETLLALGALASSASARAQERPPADDEDLRRLDTTFNVLRQRNAQDYAISSPDAIDEAKYLKIGGIEQWVTVRGENRGNPVLLLLHGGPGDATNPWGWAAFRSWLKTYTVVQWDQRGAGRTLGRNGRTSADALNLDRLVRDGIEVADAVRTSLRQPKVILLGHSFGSVLGVLMAQASPELFHAFVGTGQVGDPARSYRVAFEALLAKARALGETRAVRELEEIGPPPYADGRGYQVQRRWSNLFEGADAFLASCFARALNAPGYTVRDVNDWLAGQALSAGRLVQESMSLPATTLSRRLAVPVFVIQGAEDFTTPTALAKGFVEAVQAPRKLFTTMDGGHFAVFMNPSGFLKKLSTLPIAATNHRADSV